tara:strand:- start:111 stop:239 length:129 start_codon:yes stop_codon:yes gene_type:complete
MPLGCVLLVVQLNKEVVELGVELLTRAMIESGDDVRMEMMRI